ncbi:MAG: putative metal-binding motif-containing protein [Sandaracinaceae bacterium]|nr:putative metal-binding motif-containing protein [Sandaracinaceae bacterium]
MGNKKDCDDGDSAVSPAASEVCDGIDNNCDGLTDDGSAIDATSYYLDGDCDGFGDASALTPSCTSLGDDYTTDSSDCDDADAAASPAPQRSVKAPTTTVTAAPTTPAPRRSRSARRPTTPSIAPPRPRPARAWAS